MNSNILLSISNALCRHHLPFYFLFLRTLRTAVSCPSILSDLLRASSAIFLYLSICDCCDAFVLWRRPLSSSNSLMREDKPVLVSSYEANIFYYLIHVNLSTVKISLKPTHNSWTMCQFLTSLKVWDFEDSPNMKINNNWCWANNSETTIFCIKQHFFSFWKFVSFFSQFVFVLAFCYILLLFCYILPFATSYFKIVTFYLFVTFYL